MFRINLVYYYAMQLLIALKCTVSWSGAAMMTPSYHNKAGMGVEKLVVCLFADFSMSKVSENYRLHV